MIDLKTCKYKGVEFLFTEMPTTGGNRLIRFNYPGSDKQSIERQGKAPRTFNITAVIPHDNYFQKRDELLRVLEDGESGVFTHPTFGDVENVINGIYSLDEKITELGRAAISIPLFVDDAKGIPVQSEDLVSQVEELEKLFNLQIDLDVGGLFNVSLEFPENFADSFEQLSGLADKFTDFSNIADSIVENASQFTKSIDGFKNNINGLIKEPLQLASEIDGLFQEAKNLYENPEDVLQGMVGMFDFGDLDPIIEATTSGKLERLINRKLIRETVQSKALSFAYTKASDIVYETTDALDLVQNTIEDQYEKIRDFTDVII